MKVFVCKLTMQGCQCKGDLFIHAIFSNAINEIQSVKYRPEKWHVTLHHFCFCNVRCVKVM